MNTHSFSRSVLILIFIGFLTNCAVHRLPTRNEHSQILAGDRSILLFRVTAELLDGTPVSAFPTNFMPYNVNIGLGTSDTDGELELVDSPLSLSLDLRDEGWIYLILEPGTYYVGIMEPDMTDYFTRKQNMQLAQRWRIDIPEGTRLIYIGTIHLHCGGMMTVFLPKIAKTCIEIDESRTVIRNEAALSQKLAAEYFGDYGSPKIMPMQRLDLDDILIDPSDIIMSP